MNDKNKHNDLLLKKYQIKWNSFPDYLAESNKNLYDEKEFADVTLVSDDLTEVEAHKTVLSNASTLLKKLLKIKSVNHPILFLKGINGKDLDSRIEFKSLQILPRTSRYRNYMIFYPGSEQASLNQSSSLSS